MLSSKPRPVPSKAALKVLYQLAYISSGTAVGVAALCAEERRRRTQIVQRIAENAKRIRQSPRHYHNAVAAVQEAQEDLVGSGVLEWVAPYRGEGQGLDRRKARSFRQEHDAEAAIRGPELPSAVEAGYEAVGAQTAESTSSVRQSTRRRPYEALPPGRDTKAAAAGANSGGDGARASHLRPPSAQPSELQEARRDSLAHRPHRPGEESAKVQSAPLSLDFGAGQSISAAMKGRSAEVPTKKRKRAKKEEEKADDGGLSLDLSRSWTALEPTAPWLLDRCRKLLSYGKLQEATDLILELRKACEKSEDFKAAVTGCFDQALAAGSLSVCCKLLPPLEAVSSEMETQRYYESFLQLCDAKASYNLILDVFGPDKPSRRSSAVGKSDRSNEIIAFALTKMPPTQMTSKLTQHFTDHFRQVPPAMRTRIVESRTSLRVRAAWQSTHNLRNVRRHMEESRKFLFKEGDAASLEALDRTMLDIFVSANALDQALRFIANKQRSKDLGAHSVGTAAVLFAKKGAWELLVRLLSVAEESKVLTFDADSTRKFNNTIHLYAKQHTTTETWKFVTTAIDNLGFSPNQATSEIMLQSFVSRSSISLIPKWLRYMRVLGAKVVLDARVAAKLLTRFYLVHRPSHVMIMWFCRNLTHVAPSLAGPEFIELVKHAIGYDLKKMTSASAGWRRSHARFRSGLEAGAGGVAPSPGWRWGEELHLMHPNGSTATTSNTRSTSAESNEVDRLPTYRDGQFSPLQDLTTGRSRPSKKAASHLQRLDNDEFDQQRKEAEADGAAAELLAAFNAEPVKHSLLNTKAGEVEAMSELTDGSSSTAVPDDLRFIDLRPAYQRAQGDEAPRNPSERDMLLALSLEEYHEVTDMYHRTLDAAGLPASPMALEIAVEASLRKHAGDSAEADAMMADAKAVGMNITCAMGPLLIHKLRRLQTQDKTVLRDLRESVIDYYRMNEENGWPVKHHVGVTAADRLIRCRQPEYAINILSTIYRSDWAIDRLLDMTAMTVFLKGYVALGSTQGLRWVIKHVLETNMRIDQIFLHTLKASAKKFRERGVLRHPMDETTETDFRLILDRWIQRCYERRAQQMLETKLLGRKLVTCLAQCANKEPAIDVSVRRELEDSLLGERIETQDTPDYGLRADRPASTADPVSSYTERRKARMAATVHALDKRGRAGTIRPRKQDVRWARQYRAFLRRELVMPDRKLASFRYRLADDPKDTLAAKRSRREAQMAAE